MSREGFLDVLVEAGLFGSRSEAAAFLIGAGVDAQHELFERVGEHSAEIKKIRQSLKQDALKALRHVIRVGQRSRTARTKD
jgi:Arc/MetJ-type ribon-helix-helix transcriptional regulator